MAMLAEPRRKQKIINLRAKHNAWSKDPNKFGQRMLEKMGWSTGKGLGAKENGIVEHIVARYKNDEKGLGFEDRNDQWTKHEDDFNALLTNLSNGNDSNESLHSGVSLEVKSKKSKARIHYHKFTRGKDISRYSEKDLANIFGKKSFKDAEAKATVKEDIKTTEQVFTDKGNMDEYFKNKISAIKSKTTLIKIENLESKEEDVYDYAFQGFSNSQRNPSDNIDKSDCGLQSFSFYDFKKDKCVPSINELSEPKLEIEEEAKSKKRRKKSHCKDNQDESLPVNPSVSQEEYVEIKEEPPKKLKQKKNEKHIVEEEDVKYNKLKKKKKNKQGHNEIKEEIQEENIEVHDDYIPKKKKKRKNKEM